MVSIKTIATFQGLTGNQIFSFFEKNGIQKNNINLKELVFTPDFKVINKTCNDLLNHFNNYHMYFYCSSDKENIRKYFLNNGEFKVNWNDGNRPSIMCFIQNGIEFDFAFRNKFDNDFKAIQSKCYKIIIKGGGNVHLKCKFN